MKMQKIDFKRLGLTLLVATSFVVGQGARNGTSAASQLLIPQGARYLSGGGAVAKATGIEAAYWNPAGLARSENAIDAIFSNRSYIADVAINYFGAAAKFGKLGTVAVTVRTFDIGEIMVTDIFNPDGTGAKFNPSYLVVGATVSKTLSDRTSMGLSVNYIDESFARVGASGVTLDAGVQYSSFLDITGLTIGVALRNFGNPMTYGGSALWVDAEVGGADRQTEWYKVQAGSFDMPFIMDIGANYSMGAIDLGVTYDVNHFAQDEVKFMGQFNIGDFASVQAGYLMNTEEAAVEDDPDTAFDESTYELPNIFTGVSFGASLNLKSIIGTGLSIDYALFPTQFFDTNQVISLRLGF